MNQPQITLKANGSAFSFEKDFPVGKRPTIQEFANHVANRCAEGSQAVVFPSGRAFEVKLANGGSEYYQFTTRDA